MLRFMSETWHIRFDDLSRPQWDGALAGTPAPYQQDWAYGVVMAENGARLKRIAIYDQDDVLVSLAQMLLRPFALIATFGLCSYGPVWLKDLDEAEKTAALVALRKAIKLRWPRLVAFTLDETFAPKGFRRVMTGDATIRLDLTQDEDGLRKALDGKWRNRLVAAEKSDLRFTSAGTKPGQYQWLLDEEIKQRKSKGYRGLPVGLTHHWQSEKSRARGADKRGGVYVYRADLGKEAAGAMLFLTHGAMATYHIGWSSDDGRKTGAHNLVLWNAMLALKEKGIRVLDLGGVNTQSGAGIARFKIGTGGALHQRSGTFV